MCQGVSRCIAMTAVSTDISTAIREMRSLLRGALALQYLDPDLFRLPPGATRVIPMSGQQLEPRALRFLQATR